MQLKNITIRLLLLFSMLASYSANAIQVNTMLSVVDDTQEKPAFTVTNNDGLTLFVRTEMAEITVKDNKIIEIPYTNDNISTWKINTTPAKLMLLNGQAKDIYADYLCLNDCNETKDTVFRVSFIPQPYIDPEKKQSENNSVALLVGFAPLLVVPAKDPIIDYNYQLDKENSTLSFNNKGTTLLSFSINTCTPAKLRDGEQCQASYPVLAGRNRSFTIPENIINNAKKITVVNHDESFIKTSLL